MNLDHVIGVLDNGLRTLLGPAQSSRPNPAENLPEEDMSMAERRHAAGLMRVNHSGEICAQALYQGQAFTCKTPHLKESLDQAAREEEDHLAWTHQRLTELGSRTSIFNPFWYGASFTLGAVAGVLGDPWNLGFLEETEKQVEAHLSSHLTRLPVQDQRSRAILEQMKEDERQHGEMAHDLGSRPLPLPVQMGMKAFSRVLTTLCYRI